jgi:hypothetical protein
VLAPYALVTEEDMEKVTEMHTSKRGRIGTKRGGGLPRLLGFILGFFQRQRDNPVRNCRGQAAVFKKSEEEKWRGGIGEDKGISFGGHFGLGIARGKRDHAHLARERWGDYTKVMTCGLHLSSGEKKEG